ncbi:MAG: GNAT family N-acetyltransferase [bacterium]
MATNRPVPVTETLVRRAAPADGHALFGAWQRLRAYNAEVDRRVIPAPVSEDEFISDLEHLLQRPRSVTLVAERQNALAGFISGSVEQNLPDRLPESHVTVGYLWVEERFRRLGIARALFQQVAEWAATQDGVGHFEMAVLTADESAARFWRAIGFGPFIERLWAPLSAPERDE